MLISPFRKTEYHPKFAEMEAGISVVSNPPLRGNPHTPKKNNEIKLAPASELLGIKIWVDSI